MKKQPKDASQIKLERETRKRLIKYILTIIIPLYGVLFCILLVLEKDSGHSILWVISSQMPLSIITIILAISLIPFLWFISKSEFKSKIYDDMLKEISKSLVDKMLIPNKPVEVVLIKARDVIYGDFILDLQYDVADFYAVLGKKDNLISIYAVLKGEDKKRKVDVISKEEFLEYYQLFDK